jgi:hypothetical protein
MLASHQRNHSAPAQDQTRPIPPSEQGCPLQRHNIFMQRSPHPQSPWPDPNLRYSRPSTPEPVYPSLSEWPRTPEPTFPAELANPGPQIHPISSYTEDWSLIRLLFCPFFPEDIYLGCMVPTCNKEELNHFRSHYRYLLQHHLDYKVDHLLTDIFCICLYPIVFAGFLWKYRTTIIYKGILEDY